MCVTPFRIPISFNQLDEQTLKAKFDRASWRKAVSFAWSRIPDPLARRQLKMLATRGRNSLTDDKFNEVMNDLVFQTLRMDIPIYERIEKKS